MRINRLISTAIGGVLFAGMGTSAHAGCFGGNAQNCNPQTLAHPAPVEKLAPIHTYGQNPYGHLRTFAYKNTPNVNIMRLHSRAPMVTLADRPIAFTSGCNPRSSVYCRAPQNNFQRVPSNSAYAPTVQRLPRFQPAPPAAPYIAPPAPVPTYTAHKSYTVNVPNVAPKPSTNVIGNVVTNQYSYQPAGGGNYWEKTSGPTMVDGLPATQIICRRQAPRPAPVTVRVVSPVIGIPVPVPTPVPVPMNTCGPVANSGFDGPVLAGGPPRRANRYGSRWTY